MYTSRVNYLRTTYDKGFKEILEISNKEGEVIAQIGLSSPRLLFIDADKDQFIITPKRVDIVEAQKVD